jgi:phosphoglycolate phosphatase
MLFQKVEISHIIWDWNGTLLNDAQYSWRVFNTISVRRGLPEVTFDRYQELYMHPVEKMYENAGFDFSKEPFSVVTQEWHDLYVEKAYELTLFGDANQAIEYAKRLNISQHIVSALPHSVLEAGVKRQEVYHHFSTVCGLDDLHGRSKVENARELANQLEVTPTSILVIGDSSHDAEVARALGARCVLVTSGYEDSGRLSKNGYPLATGAYEALQKGLHGPLVSEF